MREIKPGKLYILMGPPGSRKTSWARRFIAERPAHSIVRTNRDDLRNMLLGGYGMLDDRLADVMTSTQHAGVVAALRAGVDVIVDDINLDRKYRDPLVDLARSLNAEFTFVAFDVSVGRCVTQDAKRIGSERVGEEWVRKMHAKFKRELRKIHGLPTIWVKE